MYVEEIGCMYYTRRKLLFYSNFLLLTIYTGYNDFPNGRRSTEDASDPTATISLLVTRIRTYINVGYRFRLQVFLVEFFLGLPTIQ